MIEDKFILHDFSFNLNFNENLKLKYLVDYYLKCKLYIDENPQFIKKLIKNFENFIKNMLNFKLFSVETFINNLEYQIVKFTNLYLLLLENKG